MKHIQHKGCICNIDALHKLCVLDMKIIATELLTQNSHNIELKDCLAGLAAVARAPMEEGVQQACCPPLLPHMEVPSLEP